MLKRAATGKERRGFATRSIQFRSTARPPPPLGMKTLALRADSGDLHIRHHATWGVWVSMSKKICTKISPAVLVLVAAVLFPSSQAQGADPYLAQAALEMGEYEVARDLYEEMHENGSADASFILNDLYRRGAFGTADQAMADHYRDIAADRGHPEAIAEICVDAGDQARRSGDFTGILDVCWQGAMQDPNHGFHRFHRLAFTFEMARYYAARALEQSDEAGLAWLCYWSVARDIAGNRDDMSYRPTTREAWEVTTRRVGFDYPAAAHINDHTLDGKTKIGSNEFREWEPCGLSVMGVVRLLVEYRLDLR